VDKDYDTSPAPEEFEDVYVTPGYSIENECVRWSVVEAYVRAHFDVADAGDESALADIKTMYEGAWNSYVQMSKDLHKFVFVCRRSMTRCLPGDDLGAYFRVDWTSRAVSVVFDSQDHLLELLQVAAADRPTTIARLAGAVEFERLDPLLEWRGKFHLGLVRSLLLYLAGRRTGGVAPFARPARIVVDPGHPSLLGAIGAYVPVPECLGRFIRSALEPKAVAI